MREARSRSTRLPNALGAAFAVVSVIVVVACGTSTSGAEPRNVQTSGETRTAQQVAQPTPAAPQPPASVTPPPSAAGAQPTAPGTSPTTSPTTTTPPAVGDSRTARVLRYDDKDPLADLEKADELDRAAAQGGKTGDRREELAVAIPPRGCVVSERAQRIWSEPGIATVAALGSEFVVAGYAKTPAGERVFVLQLPESGLPQPVAALHVEPPLQGTRVAAPGLAADAAQGATLAFVNGAGALQMQRLHVGATHGAGATLDLAKGVDPRFAPAVGFAKRGPLIAYTLSTTPMKTQLARIDQQGALIGTQDVTPAAMGAAAPAFVSGEKPAALITTDARDGVSPIARTAFTLEGEPKTADTFTSVGMLSEPAQLTAAHADFGTFVAYAGLGAAATSAIGLVQIAPKPGSPDALIKGTAYGRLHVSAIGAGNALLIAADAPLGTGKSPAHEIQVVRIDAQGKGPVLHITDPGGDATQAALARNDTGSVALVFSGKDGIYVTKLSCAR